MGLGSILSSAVGALTGGPVGSIIGGVGGSLFEDWMSDSNAKDAWQRSKQGAQDQWNREYGAYKTRYQDTTADMRKAGLNPILAATSGFNVSGGGAKATAATPYMSSGSSGNIASSAQQLSKTKKTEEETKTEIKRRELIKNQALESIAKKVKHKAETRKIRNEEKIAAANIFNAEKRLEQIKVEIAQAEQDTKLKEKLTEQARIQIDQMRANLQAMQNMDKIYSGPAGQLLSYLKLLSEILGISTGYHHGTFKGQTRSNSKSTSRSTNYNYNYK